jgi:S1-C subfamily serine protease
MQKGDVIVGINGKAINNIYDYMHRLGKLKKGDRINVEILRNEKKLILIIDL